MPAVHHRYATVDGHRLFYREAGDPGKPALVLLHGFPTSSRMFRHLIPALADRYHVIATDHLGFGFSDAPAVTEFDYTFDALTDLTAGLLGSLGVDRYALYVQDYGAPIGWRLALRAPSAITAIISQNGNGYDAGFVWQAFGRPCGPTRPTRPRRPRLRYANFSVWTRPAGNTSPAWPTRRSSTPSAGITTSRCYPGPAMTWCS
ncbi:alpha/beta fold hydrolase [Mycobacterium lentiflavum]|uniref:alpha/beta fold hydrolase n=1 Tax=Mycobacterium lentiflavum TaxID=141349 RepID=UPI003B84AB1C